MEQQHQTLILIGGALLAFALIGSGPFVGWYITRRNRLQNVAAVRPLRSVPQPFTSDDSTYEWLANGKPRNPRRVGSAPYLRPAQFPSATDCYAQALAAPFLAEVRRIDEETRELETAPESTPQPAWAGEATQGWSVIEADVYTSELAEVVGETGLSQAEQAWLADPLASVCLPPEGLTVSSTPLAHRAFDALVLRQELTGEGADLDFEWEAWNLYEKESITA